MTSKQSRAVLLAAPKQHSDIKGEDRWRGAIDRTDVDVSLMNRKSTTQGVGSGGNQ